MKSVFLKVLAAGEKSFVGRVVARGPWVGHPWSKTLSWPPSAVVLYPVLVTRRNPVEKRIIIVALNERRCNNKLLTIGYFMWFSIVSIVRPKYLAKCLRIGLHQSLQSVIIDDHLSSTSWFLFSLSEDWFIHQ